MKKTSTSLATYFGLLIAFLAVPLVIYLHSLNAPNPYTDSFILLKEASIFATAGILLLIIIQGERKGLDSIGFHNQNVKKTIGTTLGLVIVLFGTLILCAWGLDALGIEVGGNEGKKYDSVSLWTMTLVTIRAGVVEEICYRGYIMERLEKMSNGNVWVFLILPVVIFSLAHYSQGIAGIVISFIAGLILAFAYWKKRDLKANIIAHFLVDFIPNVLFQLG